MRTFQDQLSDYNQNRSKYSGIKPTLDGKWQVRGRQIVSSLKVAVIIRDGVPPVETRARNSRGFD